MTAYLAAYHGRSSTACPGPGDWLQAFGDAENIFCVTITSNLSGSYNAACAARDQYLQEHPERQVYILDSLSVGPEMQLILEYFRAAFASGASFADACAAADRYRQNTRLMFMLSSMRNLANNGRVKPLTAKAAGLLGIRVIGDANMGQITPIHKVRGHKKAMQIIVEMMKERGFYDGSLIRVAACFAESQTNDLKALVLAKWPNTRFVTESTRGLCSFYAEVGGLMIGIEAGPNEHNNPSLFK